jgi:flagellar brake protein
LHSWVKYIIFTAAGRAFIFSILLFLDIDEVYYGYRLLYHSPSSPDMIIDNNATEVISNLPYITYLLLKASGNRNVVTITSASHGINHASAILEINETDNSLLFDTLRQGQFIPDDIPEYTVMLEEVKTWFTVNKFTREKVGEDVFYRTPLPNALYRVQRRNYYRVAVPTATNGRIKALVEDHRQIINGMISDISFCGVGFTVPSDVRTLFKPQSVITDVFIELGDLCSLTADLEVRHVDYSNKTKSTSIGSKFCNLDASKSQKIAFTVQELQRIELRNRKH